MTEAVPARRRLPGGLAMLLPSLSMTHNITKVTQSYCEGTHAHGVLRDPPDPHQLCKWLLRCCVFLGGWLDNCPTTPSPPSPAHHTPPSILADHGLHVPWR